MAELGVTLGSAGIPIQTSPDINSPDRAPLAHAVVETLHLDMHQVAHCWRCGLVIDGAVG